MGFNGLMWNALNLREKSKWQELTSHLIYVLSMFVPVLQTFRVLWAKCFWSQISKNPLIWKFVGKLFRKYNEWFNKEQLDVWDFPRKRLDVLWHSETGIRIRINIIKYSNRNVKYPCEIWYCLIQLLSN